MLHYIVNYIFNPESAPDIFAIFNFLTFVWYYTTSAYKAVLIFFSVLLKLLH